MALDSGSRGSFGGHFSATECPICMNIFGDCRVPLATPCGHTFCRPCAVSVSGTGKPFDCPLCRERIDSLESLKVNVALRDLIDQVKAMSLRRTASQPCGSSTFPSINLCDVMLEELLDTGAFGEVHRARWRNEIVAVKVIRARDMTPHAVDSFYREVEVMNYLRHPNVVMMLAACTGAPQLGIVMEYVGGGSLYRLLHVQQRKLTDGQLKDVALDVTHGIRYLHTINIMHRDLKSKNVLLTDTKPATAKLCDFGLSRIRIETATMTGNIGTAQWTAPEILNESRYTFKADIYSFGMVLLEMVSNQVPFSEMHPLAIVMAVGLKKKKPKIPPNIHPSLIELIQHCLEWDPRDRASVATVMKTLNDFGPANSDKLDLSEKVAELYHQPSFDSLMRTGNPCNGALDQSRIGAGNDLDPDLLKAGSRNPYESSAWDPESKSGMTAMSEYSTDPQQAADWALALQLQNEEQKVCTAGDSDLALQLHHIEGAKAERGIAGVDLDGGESFPFHPTGIFLGELKDVVKKRKQAKPASVEKVDSGLPAESHQNQSMQGAMRDEVDPSCCSDDAPVLSSLVRIPSKSKSATSHMSSQESGEAKRQHPKPYLSDVQLFDRKELKEIHTQEKNTLPSWEAVALEQMFNHKIAHHEAHRGHERHISDPMPLSSRASLERSDSAYESIAEAPARLEQISDGTEEGSSHSHPLCPVGSAFQKVVSSLKSVPTSLKESVPPSWKEAIRATWRDGKGMWPGPAWIPPFRYKQSCKITSGHRAEDQQQHSSPVFPRCTVSMPKQSTSPHLPATSTGTDTLPGIPTSHPPKSTK